MDEGVEGMIKSQHVLEIWCMYFGRLIATGEWGVCLLSS